jgi:hypothetical protein
MLSYLQDGYYSDAAQDGEHADAAQEMLSSKWATQVGNQAVELADRMENG